MLEPQRATTIRASAVEFFVQFQLELHKLGAVAPQELACAHSSLGHQ